MITVAEYIAVRLMQLGAEHLFCVPGNYSAEFLLAAQKAGLECVGTTNELEAGYAADAYARYKGIGVCSVTYGVGAQSAYNAVAGAYVEFCPLVLLNGSPPLAKVENLRNNGILFAHAIDPLRTDRVIFDPITVATAEIREPENAPAEIDRVLRACITLGGRCIWKFTRQSGAPRAIHRLGGLNPHPQARPRRTIKRSLLRRS